MGASAQYGALLALIFVLADHLPPHLAGLLWFALACHSTWGACAVWRRTGLALSSIAIGLAGANLALIAAFIWNGHRPFDWPAGWVAFFFASTLVGGVCMLVENRRDAPAWAAWRRHMDTMNAWDVLLGRHIPRLRGTRSLP